LSGWAGSAGMAEVDFGTDGMTWCATQTEGTYRKCPNLLMLSDYFVSRREKMMWSYH